MAWEDSNRRQRLPKEWPRIRSRILLRDGYRCTHTDIEGRCGAAATDVDHIRPGDDDSDSNLRSLCSAHHRVKSAREGGQASAIAKRNRANRFRRIEKHPGLL